MTKESIYKQKWYLENKEKILEKRKSYYENNKEKLKEKREENKNIIKERNKQWKKNNAEYVRIYKKEYNQRNKDHIQKQRKAYKLNYKCRRNELEKQKKNTNEVYKLGCNIRQSIANAFKAKGFKKNLKTQQILGCTFEEFKVYIENKFECWMTWQNKGNWNGIPTTKNTAWDIDHIIPICTATTIEEMIKLNHYTNFQPLCGYTNRYIKNSKLI